MRDASPPTNILLYLLQKLKQSHAWTKLQSWERGQCSLCDYLEASSTNETGSFLRTLVAGSTSPVDIHEPFLFSRKVDTTEYLLPTFTATRGSKLSLHHGWSWSWAPAGRMKSAKFLSTYLTLLMQAVYSDGQWIREFQTVELPGSFGEQNIKSAAVQDAARSASSPAEMIDFGDHKFWATSAIYLVR